MEGVEMKEARRRALTQIRFSSFYIYSNLVEMKEA